ncbi:hypothetical protein FRC17_002895 [Serendipita sp. 399]|nr:hypothetical protein FRC17_002895 [Serendipita sp. 399]
MANYIMENHSTETGIVYCLSKKDAESVATGLSEVSNGKIRTGVYHADIADNEKERLHRRWRSGEVKVVCATIAFGLGIDKGDVRFILHHSMSKSIDGYYQESGRGGRDGKDSDCILYYRGQDASRLLSLVCGEREGQAKLYDMLRFAQNVIDCRKLLFAQYFSTSSSLSLSAWSAEGSETLSPCGHCDNCTRSPDELDRDKDVTVEAWKILKIVGAIKEEGGKATLSMLSDLVRGAGGGSIETSNGGKGRSKQKEKVQLDVDAICEGKVEMHKDDERERVLPARSHRGSGAVAWEDEEDEDDPEENPPERQMGRVPTSDEEEDSVGDDWEVSFGAGGKTPQSHSSYRANGVGQPDKKRMKTSSSTREIDTMSVIDLSD